MSKGSRPVFLAKVKQSPDSDYMHVLGAAFKFREGEGLVVKLNLIPTNWDGTFILVAPTKKDEE